ncbi:hypothetical protein [Streptomyces ortus]|uniref:Nematocidal protein AidA n=1 Tax=Streptomyces ortus TaxID=2867268 RepID=A0ABT3UWR2_9ACTN|nr:hypothetical protein [Streptomyces ortus]MCX4231768.1 hypothetical protein [Streptomyces ortus]
MTIKLVRDVVNVYDLNTRQFVRCESHTMSRRQMAAARVLDDTLTEYATTDRDGNPLCVVLQVENDLSEWADYSLNAGGERVDAGTVWEFTGTQTSTAADVAVYDIEYDVRCTADRADREPWERIAGHEADGVLADCAAMGDTVQTYEMTARDGTPLRIALLLQGEIEAGRTDMGAVYEYTL